MTLYRVTHVTTYTYDDDVTDSFGVAWVQPRLLPWQQVADSAVVLDPTPSDLSTDIDFYGNQVTYFQVTEPHRTLKITATSEVEVLTSVHDLDALAAPWESARPIHNRTDPSAWLASDMALESAMAEHSEAAQRYGAESLRPGRPLGEAVTDLMHRIHREFRYEKGATTVSSTVTEILATRTGVCQDFAHLMLACLRTHGLAARYVSGYLSTTPPPGTQRMVGADATHAWVSVWVPGSGEWLALDPTNDQWAGDHHVTAAWGRDYADVPPVKGVIFTDATTSTLEVSVDVSPRPTGHLA
ncbi:MAG: transglutaminase family protein [Nocardioides sp.]